MIPAGAVQRKTVPPQMHKTKHWRRNQNEQTKRRGAAASVEPEGLHCCRKLLSRFGRNAG